MRAGQCGARIREGSILIRKVFRVLGREMFLIFRQIIDRVNRVGSASRHAGSAIDAAVGLDVQLSCRFKLGIVFFRMNAVGGADVNTKKIFDTRVGDHISHDEVFLSLNWSLATSPECEGN